MLQGFLLRKPDVVLDAVQRVAGDAAAGPRGIVVEEFLSLHLLIGGVLDPEVRHQHERHHHNRREQRQDQPHVRLAKKVVGE